MSRSPTRGITGPDSRARHTLAAAGIAAVAIACCAALPIAAGVLGGVTVAAVLGAAAGAVSALAIGGAALWIIRRRRRADPSLDVTRTGRKRGPG